MESASDANIKKPPAATQAQINKPLLQRGSTGEDVEELQKLLTHWEAFTGKIDSNFGQQTEQGVKAFQHRVFLLEDGIVGKLTWQALYVGAPVNMPILKQGSRGQVVTMLQRVLKETRDYGAPIDGDFGPQTDTAVKAFQKRSNLPIDGVVEERTWHSLSKVPH